MRYGERAAQVIQAGRIFGDEPIILYSYVTAGNYSTFRTDFGDDFPIPAGKKLIVRAIVASEGSGGNALVYIGHSNEFASNTATQPVGAKSTTHPIMSVVSTGEASYNFIVPEGKRLYLNSNGIVQAVAYCTLEDS